MSFLDKIKNLGKNETEGQAEAAAADSVPSGAVLVSTQSHTGPGQLSNSSIISEALPTEQQGATEFGETTATFATTSAALDGPVTEQHTASKVADNRSQSLLIALVAVGLLGTAATVSLSLVGGSRSAAQVRAAGQALMHSANRFTPSGS